MTRAFRFLATLRGWVALLCGLGVLLLPTQALAFGAYDTYYVNANAGGAATQYSQVQNLYTPSFMVSGAGVSALSQPGGLYVADNGDAYVADTGNNRIAVFNAQGHYLRQIGSGILNAPEGVFVTPQGRVYVADTGNSRIAVFTAQGKLVRVYRRPHSPLLPSTWYFAPQQVVVDARGVMYVVSQGSYQGLVRLSPSGQFLGFYGANLATESVAQRLESLFFSKAQLAQQTAVKPLPVTNLSMANGYLYATTLGAPSQQVRQLNVAGMNRLVNFVGASDMIDAVAGKNGFLYVLNQSGASQYAAGFSPAGPLANQMVSIYSPTGTLLFTFGRTSQTPEQLGVLSSPGSLALSPVDHALWIVDAGNNSIQVFRRTAFGRAMLTAAADYYLGFYQTSQGDWRRVEQVNSLVDLPYKSLGQSDLLEGRYAQAMANFQVAYDVNGYSQAFWMYRYHWLEQHFGFVLGGLVALWVLYRYGIKRGVARRLQSIRRPGVRRVLEELRLMGVILWHPYDGFYRSKGTKVSGVTLALVLGMVLAVNLLSVYKTGFVFNPVDLRTVNVNGEVGEFFGVWATWLVSNYLISTIKNGEGTFREGVQASVYALAPYLLLTVPLVLLTNVLTLQEAILVNGLQTILWIWVLVLFFVSAQVIHNYEFLENIKVILLTIPTILLLWGFLAVCSGLTLNLYNFVYAILREVHPFG